MLTLSGLLRELDLSAVKSVTQKKRPEIKVALCPELFELLRKSGASIERNVYRRSATMADVLGSGFGTVETATLDVDGVRFIVSHGRNATQAEADSMRACEHCGREGQ